MTKPISFPSRWPNERFRFRTFGRMAHPVEAPILTQCVSVVCSSHLALPRVLIAHDSTRDHDCLIPYTVCLDIRGLLCAMKGREHRGIREDGIVSLEKSMFCDRGRFEDRLEVYSVYYGTFELVHVDMSGECGGEISTLATDEVQSCSARIIKHFSSRGKKCHAGQWWK
jgi:hypothetical protein